jgi:hypothetical protein
MWMVKSKTLHNLLIVSLFPLYLRLRGSVRVLALLAGVTRDLLSPQNMSVCRCHRFCPLPTSRGSSLPLFSLCLFLCFFSPLLLCNHLSFFFFLFFDETIHVFFLWIILHLYHKISFITLFIITGRIDQTKGAITRLPVGESFGPVRPSYEPKKLW